MPNGNELANVLRWPKGKEYEYSWYAGQQLPEEWWKTDFPYGEAERMGYKLSPEETRKFYERKKREKEKTLSEELADILKRPEVKMLTAPERADLIDKIAKAQAAIATREQQREKHETEMLEIGRQTQMQARVKAILESDRVPAQKVTALTMAGVPLGDARDLVWGKRAPEEGAGRPSREAAPTARAKPTGEELATALRPEARGVRVFEGAEGLITTPVIPPSTAAERAEYRIDNEIAAKERERRDNVEKARQLRNEAIGEKTRGNIAEAMRIEREAKEKEEEAGRLNREKIELEGIRLKAEKREEEEKRLERERGIYERVREAARPLTRMEEIELEKAEIGLKEAEEARLEAKFAPGELHRKYLYALDEARKQKNESIYERKRDDIAKALVAEAEEARLEAEARRLMIAEVEARGVEMSAEKKAEEKERLERDRKIWEDKREEIKGLMDSEALKEEAKAKERQERMDYLDSKAEVMKTAKEKKEEERLQKLQEKWEGTRKAIKEAIEKDEQQERDEEKARMERDKEVREIGEALADKRLQAKKDKAQYDKEQRDIARLETKEDREFAQTILDKTFNWLTVFRNLGFDHEDFIEIVPEFLRILGMNRAQEEAIAKGLGLMMEKSEEAEKEKIERFERYLNEQASAIDKRVKIEGMTPELENQIEMMTWLYLALEEKKLSEGKGLDKWSSTLKTGGWYFGPAEIPFKTKAARDAFVKKMPDVIYKTRTSDLMNAATDLLGEQAGKTAALLGKAPKAGKEVELPDGLIAACTGFSDGEKNECIETYGALFDTKGVMSEPGVGDRERATKFVIGEDRALTEANRDKLSQEALDDLDEGRTKGELPINMNDSDYTRAVLQTTTFSKKQKAWLLWKRFSSPMYWEGMRNQAGMLGNLVVIPEETEKKGIGIFGWLKGMFKEKPGTHWFFKPGEKALSKMGQWWTGEKPEEKKFSEKYWGEVKVYVDMLYDRTKSKAAVERYLKEDVGITLDEYKKWLRGRK